jgi:lysophospholipase L1-like esterase
LSGAEQTTARLLSGPLLLCATLLGLFCVFEAGFRVRAALRSPAPLSDRWAIHDEELGYRNRPSFGDHNPHGLRGAPLEDPKRRLRLLVVGDSVVYYGEDSDDTLPGQLASIIDPEHESVEVVNAGTRGYTNFQETRWIERHGLAMDPDAIVVVFVLNDLHRFLHRFDVVNGEIVGAKYHFAEQAVESVESPIYRLARKSHFLVWLRRTLAIFDDLVELYVQDGFSFDYRPDFAPAWRDEPWHAVEAQLAGTAALTRSDGIPIFLVAVPFGDQLRPEIVARDPEYAMRPQRKLRGIADRIELPLLDLLPFLELDRDFEADGIHLSPAGRRRAAERIAEFLAREERFPPTLPENR